MADTTGIQWTDHTHNPWTGCQAVSPGCDNCYAETLSRHRKWARWGPGEERRLASESTRRRPYSWNRRAAREGERRRVFCASLADVFDNQAPPGAREELWEIIAATDRLDWQLLTKRPQNFDRFLPPDWGTEGYPNVWLGVSAENQREYDRRWPILAETPARVRFISYEPALGPLSLLEHETRPHWVIWGGESGPGARPMDPDWARAVTAQCRELEIPVFGKQWGDYPNNPLVREQGLTLREAKLLDPVANGKGGALLDGALIREFPQCR